MRKSLPKSKSVHKGNSLGEAGVCHCYSSAEYSGLHRVIFGVCKSNDPY